MRREGTVGGLLSRAFAILVVLIICSGLVELATVVVQHRASQQLTGEVQPLQLANAELRAVLTDAQSGLRGYLLTGDEQMLGRYRGARSDYALAGDELRRRSGERYAAAASDQIALAQGWWANAENQRRASPRGNAAAGYAERGEPLFQAFADANEDLRSAVASRADDLRAEAGFLRGAEIVALVLLTAVMTGVAVVTAVSTSRRLTRPLSAVVETLDRVRDGEQDARADVTNGPAEIRAVAEAVNAVADRSDQIRRDSEDARRDTEDSRRRDSEHIRRNEEHVNARLRALDTVKTDLMSTVSHELRTPLTSISGYLELMRDSEPGELNAAQLRMIEVISRNTRRLRDLIEDILTLSKIESGDLNSDRTPLDLAKLIDRALVAIGPVADKGSVGLHLDVRGPLPILGDGAQLTRVLDNLLVNAVKFTPAEGTVTVHAERRDDRAVLVVGDTGMGIPGDEQQALFVRFFRATNAIKQAVPGTGLGLAIARTIIDNHGGTITIDSTENVGTTVTVSIPAA